jgi:Zn-dependent protease with chaperone function
MGPFLGIIAATVVSTIALDGTVEPERVDRATPTALAALMIGLAWVTSRLHQPRMLAAMRQAPWARPMDLALYVLLVFWTDWTQVAREATGDVPLLRQVLMLSPYYLATLARVDAAWPAEPGGGRTWTRGRAVGFYARLLLVPVAPILIVNGAIDALRAAPRLAAALDAYPAVEIGLVLASFALVILVMPALLARVLGTRSLPAGPLRSALEADLARQGAKVGGIEEVDTDGMIPNAAYLGLSTRLGRIFISDALLRSMPEDETRGVFAHEVAHGTRRHLVWLLGFFSTAILALYVTADVFGGPWSAGLALVATIAAGAAGFVAISRRFEVEADLVAADVTGDAEAFARALARVAVLAGKPVDRHGLRHYAIATRIGIVRSCAESPQARALWLRRIRAPKVAIAGMAAVVAALAAWKLPADLRLSAAFQELRTAYETEREARGRRFERGPEPHDANGSDEAALRRRFQEAGDAARRELAHPLVGRRAAELGIAALMGVADAALRTGDVEEARRIAAEIERDWPRGDPIGDFNRLMLRAELAAVDPGRDGGEARAAVVAAQASLANLLSAIGRNESADLVEQELRFLAAATGVEGASLALEDATFPTARALAIALGAEASPAESREVAAGVGIDYAWRRLALARALAARALDASWLEGAPGSRRGI